MLGAVAVANGIMCLHCGHEKWAPLLMTAGLYWLSVN